MNTTKCKILAVAAAAIFTMTGQDGLNAKPDIKKKTNTEKVVELLKAIETGASAPVAYINPDKYIQHNLGAADGLAGFGAVLGALANYPEAAKVNTVRVFSDGDYVFAQTDYNFFGPKIGFDIFRFENGLIVEHWDNLMVTPTRPNPSGRTPIDGTTKITDLDKTAANKALVEQFVRDVLMGQHSDRLASYFDNGRYIQHNPSIADGLDGLGAALQWMADNGIVMRYNRIHKVLGQGNFVLVVSEGVFGKGEGEPTSFYDLFRVANGKIAEHWDVMEIILPEAQRQNSNGKFNF